MKDNRKMAFTVVLSFLLLLFAGNGQAYVNAEDVSKPYIVRFVSPEVATQTLANYKNSPRNIEQLENLGSVYIIHLNENEVTELRKIAKVYPNVALRLNELPLGEENFGEPVRLAGPDRLGVENYHALGFTGKGVKVAIFDSGIAKHGDLKVTGGVNLASDEQLGYEKDELGHGTLVAGVVGSKGKLSPMKGIAPDVDLYSVKVCGEMGCDFISALKGLDWAIEQDMDVINMSFGLGDDYLELDTQWAINEAVIAGITVVVASGNDGTLELPYPARLPNVITVGAVDANKMIAPFSSGGKAMDVVSYGVGVTSTYGNNRFLTTSGTSLSAPFITGIVALMYDAYPDMNWYTAETWLKSVSEDLGVSGPDELHGAGFPTATRLIEKYPIGTPIERNPNIPVKIEAEIKNGIMRYQIIDGFGKYLPFVNNEIVMYNKVLKKEFPFYDMSQNGTSEVILTEVYNFQTLANSEWYMVVRTPYSKLRYPESVDERIPIVYTDKAGKIIKPKISLKKVTHKKEKNKRMSIQGATAHNLPIPVSLRSKVRIVVTTPKNKKLTYNAQSQADGSFNVSVAAALKGNYSYTVHASEVGVPTVSYKGTFKIQ